jgi:hypothetical protein
LGSGGMDNGRSMGSGSLDSGSMKTGGSMGSGSMDSGSMKTGGSMGSGSTKTGGSMGSGSMKTGGSMGSGSMKTGGSMGSGSLDSGSMKTGGSMGSGSMDSGSMKTGGSMGSGSMGSGSMKTGGSMGSGSMKSGGSMGSGSMKSGGSMGSRSTDSGSMKSGGSMGSTIRPMSRAGPDSVDSKSKDSTDGYVQGDPHFKTFGGEMYDYHGECDLVLLHNPEFKNVGMDIHIRTKISDFWSAVETAAVKIGDEVIEIHADPDSHDWLWFNRQANGELEDGTWYHSQVAGFLVRYREVTGRVGLTREVNIYLEGSKEILRLKAFKSFVRIDIAWTGSKNYDNSMGLLGSQAHNGLRLARDGKTFIEDVNAFGQEWQVQPMVDGQLFHSYENAVVGKKCVLPPSMDSEELAMRQQRRLAESGMTLEDAEDACDHLVDPEEKQACVFDVLATQDLSMASAW